MEEGNRSYANSTKDDDEYEVVLSDGCIRRRRKWTRPKEQLPKGFLPEENVSLADALARIDHSHLAAFLAVAPGPAPERPPGTQVLDLVDYFGSALSGVSSVEYQYPWPNMNNLRDVIDLPFRHVPEPLYKTVEDWIEKVEEKSVSKFIIWSFSWTRNRLAGIYTEPNSELGVFVALSIILRSSPRVLSPVLPVLRQQHYHLERSPEMLQFTVWMMAQVAQVDLWSGLHSWASNLLPLVPDKLKDNPRSINLILQLIEHVCTEPGALEIIGMEEMIQITPLIFASSLKFAAEEGNAVLAKEATSIAIRCLTKNVDCCNHWDKVYMDNLEASVALLENLVDEWKDHSPKLSSSPRDIRILNLTMKNFVLKNERGLAGGGGGGGGASTFLYEEADKYCKEISRRLSRGIGFLKGCGAMILVAVVSTASVVLSSSRQD
ncbi:unnamed protein product [Microthlaspi erraticum]|uniref:Uncharacterized protein n=1 Tax=Microthlaspi erraticum TaxID=1685480 RepID=A0A6D2I029_9BRAS|nr:unnamed protein product [Microthlaspi erraticum]